LLCKCKALSSNPSPPHKKKRKEKKNRERIWKDNSQKGKHKWSISILKDANFYS
jgi:hypothetical protein